MKYQHNKRTIKRNFAYILFYSALAGFAAMAALLFMFWTVIVLADTEIQGSELDPTSATINLSNPNHSYMLQPTVSSESLQYGLDYDNMTPCEYVEIVSTN